MKTDKPRKKIAKKEIRTIRPVYNNDIHKTLCSTCHKPCEVPFKPNGLKPVFCADCFRYTKEPAPSDYIKRKDKTIFDAPHNFVQPLNPLSTVHSTSTEAKIDMLKRELSSANAKLDKLIDMLGRKGK